MISPPAVRAAAAAAVALLLAATSRDGETFATILDKTGSTTTKYTEFDELPPTECRFVRLTITDWPHIANAPLGITEFTVFGKAVETKR